MTWIKRLWNRTVFPDMIAERKERKKLQKERQKTERELEDTLRHEARLEALKISKDTIKDKMIEEEVKKIVEGKQNKFTKVLKNIGDDLANSGFKLPDNDRMRDVWGANKQPGQQTSSNMLPSQDKIASMMGGSRTNMNSKLKTQEDNKRFEQDRIKNLIGGSRTNFNVQVPKTKKKKVTHNKKKNKKNCKHNNIKKIWDSGKYDYICLDCGKIFDQKIKRKWRN